MNSPLHQFRAEVSDGFAQLNDRLTAIEAAATARASGASEVGGQGRRLRGGCWRRCSPRSRAAPATSSSAPADQQGDVLRSKKGDFVLTVNPASRRGADLRVVIEAKDRAISGRVMRDELREAQDESRRGRWPGRVHAGPCAGRASRPFDVRAGDVYCVVDPDAPDPAILEAALRLARLLAIATLREREARSTRPRSARRCRASASSWSSSAA